MKFSLLNSMLLLCIFADVLWKNYDFIRQFLVTQIEMVVWQGVFEEEEER